VKWLKKQEEEVKWLKKQEEEVKWLKKQEEEVKKQAEEAALCLRCFDFVVEQKLRRPHSSPALPLAQSLVVSLCVHVSVS
jgi:predicted adenine nucleotide alpha hydrolase (AANH) superfamily ATPase